MSFNIFTTVCVGVLSLSSGVATAMDNDCGFFKGLGRLFACGKACSRTLEQGAEVIKKEFGPTNELFKNNSQNNLVLNGSPIIPVTVPQKSRVPEDIAQDDFRENEQSIIAEKIKKLELNLNNDKKDPCFKISLNKCDEVSEVSSPSQRSPRSQRSQKSPRSQRSIGVSANFEPGIVCRELGLSGVEESLSSNVNVRILPKYKKPIIKRSETLNLQPTTEPFDSNLSRVISREHIGDNLSGVINKSAQQLIVSKNSGNESANFGNVGQKNTLAIPIPRKIEPLLNREEKIIDMSEREIMEMCKLKIKGIPTNLDDLRFDNSSVASNKVFDSKQGQNLNNSKGQIGQVTEKNNPQIYDSKNPFISFSQSSAEKQKITTAIIDTQQNKIVPNSKVNVPNYIPQNPFLT